jgi:hypothetical protein
LDVKESFHNYSAWSDDKKGLHFRLKKDATGKLDLTSYQKCMAYGVVGDLVDEYMRMSESTCLASRYKFYKAVVQVFGRNT